jgi:hypothetical protein
MTENKCETCWGHGLWPDGTAPMGPMGAGDGMPTIECPECGANPNPIKDRPTKNPDGELHEITEYVYITGTGQTLGGVHRPDQCFGDHCVIHNPSDHNMRDFPTHWRSDLGLMERICPHGVGHPDPDDLKFQEATPVHGCDGCCMRAKP